MTGGIIDCGTVVVNRVLDATPVAGLAAARVLSAVAAPLDATPRAASVTIPPGVPVLGLKPTNTAAPSLSGSPQSGQTLTCAHGTWSGTAPITYAYQWQKDGVDIAGATGSTYVPVTGDVSHQVRCRVTATNAYGSTSATTAAVTISAGPVAPSNTSAPVLSGGTFQVGQTLSCSTGSWTGTTPITYAYQWKRDGANISGATSSTYLLVSADGGHSVKCTVTASNSAGSASADSDTEAIAGGLGPAVAFTQADIGSHRYAPGDPAYLLAEDTDWIAPRYRDTLIDQGIFGRVDKAAPTFSGASRYNGILVLQSDGTQDTVNSTGGLLAAGMVSRTVNGDGTIKLTFDVEVRGIQVVGNPADNRHLHIGEGAGSGKLWVTASAWTGAGDRTEWNNLYNGTDGFAEFNDCVVALQNYYHRGGTGASPALRFNDCDTIDDTTPFIEGFFFEGAIRDDVKIGSQSTRVYFRHGTYKNHPYSNTIVDPVGNGIALTSASGSVSAPYVWDATVTYNALECVFLPKTPWASGSTYAKGDFVSYQHWNYKAAKALAAGVTPTPGASDSNWTLDTSQNHWYSLTGGKNKPLPADALGASNTDWQFYGNPHADMDQFFLASQEVAGRGAFENVFWYQGQHASLYMEMASKVQLNKLLAGGSTLSGTIHSGVWTSGVAYAVADLVFYAPASGNTNAGLYKCTTAHTANGTNQPPNASFWTLAAGVMSGGDSPPAWSSTTVYRGVPYASLDRTTRASCVRASNGQEFFAIANSGPGNGGAQDPLTSIGTYWQPASSHGVYLDYCVCHGNNLATSNPGLDPTNGAKRSVFVKGVFASNPVQGSGNSDTGNTNQINVSNYWSDGSGLIPGSL